MAKRKSKKTEEGYPTPSWVRLKAELPPNIGAGPHNLGPFEAPTGPMSVRLHQDRWTKVNGAWLDNLMAHELGQMVETRRTKPD